MRNDLPIIGLVICGDECFTVWAEVLAGKKTRIYLYSPPEGRPYWRVQHNSVGDTAAKVGPQQWSRFVLSHNQKDVQLKN